MFDWDNTIMASADFLKEVHEKTAAKLKQQNIHLRVQIPAIATKKKNDILVELFGQENLTKVLPVFQETYDEIFKPKELKMLHGARELLQKLTDAKVPFAIVSNYTEAGIKEHLDLRGFDYSKIAIIGVDTTPKTKPDGAPGLLALEKLGINPTTQKVRVLMIGDGITSDMLFAKNLNKHLKELDQDSSCDGILFNSLISGDPIFTEIEIEAFISTNKSADNKELQFNRTVAFGYGKVGKNIRDAITPYHIVPEVLENQKTKLKPVRK